ncbi:MAG: hypothetical protein WBG38_18715 [Nodosilinea sp.]
MKPNPLKYIGSFGLAASVLLWSSASRAQDYCYLIDSDGRTIDLDALCESDNAPTPGQFPQGAAEGAADIGESEAETQSSPGVRSYTITGPASVPGSGETAETSGPEAEAAAEMSPTSESASDRMDNSGSMEPAQETPSRADQNPSEGQVQEPDSQDSTTVIDTPERDANGLIIRPQSK